MPPPSPAPRPRVSKETLRSLGRPRRALRLALKGIAAAACAALLVAGCYWAWSHDTAPFRLIAPLDPIYIAVVGPTGTPAEDTVIRSTTTALGFLREVQVLSSDQVTGDTPEVVAAATGAEVVLCEVVDNQESWDVTLRRDQRTVSFSVPTNVTGSLELLSEVTAGNVRALFSRRRSAGRPLSDVSPAAWAEYLELRWSEINPTGDINWERYLGKLEAHIARHPGNTDARAKASQIATYLAQSRGDNSYLERAHATLEGGDKASSQIISAAARLALAEGDLDQAEHLVALLSATDASSQLLRSRIAVQRGELEEALDILTPAVSDNTPPLWLFLLELSQVEADMGHCINAKMRVKQLLSIDPGNIHARARLTWLELITGDPAVALELAEDLIKVSPNTDYLMMAASAQMLLGQYDEALVHLRLAETLGYRDPKLRLCQADCYALKGDQTMAEALYNSMLNSPSDTNFYSMVYRAMALASVSRSGEALQIARTLQPKSKLHTYELADLYARIDDQRSADRYIEEATSAGFSPFWFQLPWFTESAAASGARPGHRQ